MASTPCDPMMSVAQAKAQLLDRSRDSQSASLPSCFPLISAAAAAFAAGFALTRRSRDAGSHPRRPSQWTPLLRQIVAALGPIGARCIARAAWDWEERRATRHASRVPENGHNAAG